VGFRVGGKLEELTDQSCGCFGPGVVRVRSIQIHRKDEAANANQVTLAQSGLTDLLGVEKDTVKAVQIDYLPHALAEEKATVPAAYIRQRQAYVGLAVPADQNVGLRQFDGRAAGLEDEPQRYEILR
jgi:hypothetical protein